jgi:phosphoglycerol transferase MdoB-like AlkP superfamily enzyme
MNDPNGKKGMGAIMLSSFILMFIVTVGLAIIVSRLQLDHASSGVKWGLLTGVCFSAAAISISYLYVKKPVGLHIIDGLYHIIGQVIAAVILTAWH